MSESVMVIALPKAKVASRKSIFTVCGIQVNVKDKIKYDTSFKLYESPKKT